MKSLYHDGEGGCRWLSWAVSGVKRFLPIVLPAALLIIWLVKDTVKEALRSPQKAAYK